MKRARPYSNNGRATKRARKQVPLTRRRRRRKQQAILAIEKKFFDVEANADAFATTWATMEPATTNLSAVAQGDGESNCR